MALIFGTFFINIFAAVILLLMLVLLHYVYAFSYWKNRKIPYITPSIPWGSLKLIAEEKVNFGECLSQMYFKGKFMKQRYIGFYLLSEPVLMILEPSLIKAILVRDFNYFQSRGFYCDEKREPLRANLVNLPGPKWRKIRPKITPTFTSGKMKLMFNTLLKCADELENVIETHVARDQPIDSRDILEKLTINNIGSCVFGLNCDTFKDTDSEFQKYGNIFFESTMSHARKILIALRFPSLLKLFKVKTLSPEVSEFFTRIFKDTVQHREASKENRKDFIDLFIKLKNNENIDDNSTQTTTETNLILTENESILNRRDDETLTFNELAAQAFVFFTAGFETSATSLNFCLFELAQNQKIQDKLRSEILSTLEKYNGNITYDATMEMKYMEQVINESLRKYPPVPLLTRECNSNYQFPESDFVLEKGTKVWISVLGLHNDPEHYPEPEKFDPERFSKENEANRDPYVYLPFGEGPRNCIGLRFGILQIKVALITLLKKFEYTIDQSTQMPIKFSTRGTLLATNNKIYLKAKKL